MHILFCRHISAELSFSPLLDIYERNFFPRWGGGGGAGAPVHPLRTRLIAVSKAERVVELHFVQGKVF